MSIGKQGDSDFESRDIGEAARAKDPSLVTADARRRYSPPRLISSEDLELAAVGCDGTGGYGKANAFPPCNPATPGS